MKKKISFSNKDLQKNTVRERDNYTIFIFIIFIFIISYRHSKNSTSTTIKLQIKVHNILVKDYKRTQWEREIYTIFIFIIFIFIISHRHSQNSTSAIIKSEIKVHNILVKYYKRTLLERELHDLHLYHIQLYYFIQSLTRLDLDHNQIEDKSAQYLSEGLQKNTVRERANYTIFIFILPYRHSLHSTSTAIKLEIKVHNILVKDYERTQWEGARFTRSSSLSYSSLLFHTDTHYTLPLL